VLLLLPLLLLPHTVSDSPRTAATTEERSRADEDGSTPGSSSSPAAGSSLHQQ
jgi:hypothetical protein